ncbi:MAG: ATP-binding cassette domain-containing protein [Ruminiclostridium sp.]|nr:ATP-binding cassette domain-containing protein [Ruminiclostridium sp.]
MDKLFEILDFSFAYPEEETKALDGLTLDVARGEFLVLCGPSGCGKSTLLRQLKTVLAPHGVKSGDILFEGTPLDQVDHRTQSQRIGFVHQNPENQIVTDKVWHELAFGLESLGFDTPTIRRRVAEMASFFGIQTWFYKNVTDLSGGQKQLLNLASVMVLQPSVLILDEPTSQLDPIAAADFLAVLGKINRELGTTIILTEHRLEETFPLATSVAVLDRGRLLCRGTPGEVGAALREKGHSMFLAMPTAMGVWAAVENDLPCPVTVREGRDWLTAFSRTRPLGDLPREKQHTYPEGPVLACDELWFKYEKDGPDVVKGLSLAVKQGEFLALLGGNGTGKTTSLSLLAGLHKPSRGKLERTGTVGVLPQDPQTLFVKKTLREDLLELVRHLPREEQEEKTARLVALCRLEDLLDRHPYDLSGGEQQRAALAKVLLLDPEILLLDEPTKGLDAEFKVILAEILQTLLARGVTILMVSHDVEFCARYAHRCALFFDGNMVTQGAPRDFFSGNSFYTTSANRIARSLLPEAVTPEDIIAACGGDLPPGPDLPEEDLFLPEPRDTKEQGKPAPLPWWRKLGAFLSGGLALFLAVKFLRVSDLSTLLRADNLGALAADQLVLYGIMVAALVVFAACISRKSKRKDYLIQPPQESRKLARRTVTAAVLILLLIPLTLFVGVYCLGGQKYYFIALLILFETMAPFFLVFEGRKPQARELVLIAVLCAIGVAGRAAFFMLPNFKPVTALTIIAGVALGGETGFLVGAMTMLASNILFSQGPWTPWQMFAMGIIGFLAGVLFRKGWLRRTRGALCTFGVLAVLLIYGGIMNPASALLWTQSLEWEILLTYYLTGIPMDCVHAASTGLFLWFGAEPMLEKLDRIKVKYGLLA